MSNWKTIGFDGFNPGAAKPCFGLIWLVLVCQFYWSKSLCKRNS